MAHKFILNPANMVVDGNGVDNFFWPLNRNEVLAVRDTFLVDYDALIKQEAKSNNQAVVLSMMVTIVGEVLSTYRAQALKRSFSEAGLEPVTTPGGRYLGPMFEGRMPEASPILQRLQRGLAHAPMWRRFARHIRALIVQGPISFSSISRMDMHSDIVTVAMGEMIVQHAKAIDNRVRYCRFEEWFYPLGPNEGADYGGIPTNALLDNVMDVVAKAFAVGNESLDNVSAGYLRNFIREIATLGDRYMARLLAMPDRIPRHLWRGTGGLVFSRMLGHACRELGGHVTGHDHSHGEGAWSTYVETVIEYPFCDRFMVWTPAQKEMASRNLRSELIFPGEEPEIEVVPGDFRPKIPAQDMPGKQSREHGLQPLTIMYVGTLYSDDVIPFTPLVPDIVLVDWEARLFEKLKEWGYDIIYKPHPESLGKWPKGFLQEFNVNIVTEPFEAVYEQADVILFGQSNCTPFFGAVPVKCAITVADTGLHEWQPEALELLKKRCGYVSSHYDENNRLQMNWEDLHDQIKLSNSLRDTGFSRAFFSGA